MSTDKPTVTQRCPFVVDVEPGTYYWCACGKSTDQPWCDGSHAGTDIDPLEVVIEAPGRVAWCGCKHSKNGAFCDGTHSQLP